MGERHQWDRGYGKWDGVYSGACMVWRDKGCREMDMDAYRKTIQNVLEAGSHGLGLASLTVHNYMKDDEWVKALRVARDEVKGKIPIVGGTILCYSTWDAIEKAKMAIDAGGDAVLLFPPLLILGFNPRADSEIIVQHYKRFDREGIPFFVHGGPQGEGPTQIFPETIKRIALECENVVAWKILARGNIGDFTAAVDALREAEKETGRHVAALLAGDKCLVEALLNGADGNTNGAGVWRAEWDVAIYKAVKAGDITQAYAIQNRFRPVIDAVRGKATKFGTPGWHFNYKVPAWLLGKIPTPYERLPQPAVSQEEVTFVRDMLLEAGLKPVREPEAIDWSTDM